MTAAFALGLLASRLALPLVGYLVAGFLLAGTGIRGTAFLHQIAEIGVLLLLFSVGLKLRLKDLLDPRVLLSGGLHLGLFATLAFLYTKNLPLAIALGFSSTVLVAKVLEDKKELTSYHGRIALGILVFQDLVAVGLLTLYGGEGVSPWAALVLLFPLLRQGVAWLLEKSGHEELLVLFGLGMALGSGELFQHVGLSPELGALFTGALLSGHAKSAELTKGLWSLKEAFLVAFFLDIGLREGLQGLDLGLAAGLTLLSLLKAPSSSSSSSSWATGPAPPSWRGCTWATTPSSPSSWGWPWSGRAFSPTSPPWPWRWPSPWPCPPRSPVTATPYTNA